MRTIVIGDVHGCTDELRELLSLVGPARAGDQLVFVGDYLDRGPDSVGAVRLVRSLTQGSGAVALMGNHDEKYVRFHKRATTPPPPGSMPMTFPEEKVAIYRQLSPEDLAWLAALPLYHRTQGMLVVHAGVSPVLHRTFEDLARNRETRSALLRIRSVDANGKALKLGEENMPGARPWWQDYDGRFGLVVHGHQVTTGVMHGPHSLGIDTGCGYGGSLTAAVMEDGATSQFVSVKARRVYATPFAAGDTGD